LEDENWADKFAEDEKAEILNETEDPLTKDLPEEIAQLLQKLNGKVLLITIFFK
jgi:hypothetical protein